MSYGPSTYQQVGGEVYDTEPGGQHTATALGSGWIPPLFGYGWSAYQRNVQYISSANTYHPLSLMFYAAPSCEGDYSIGGLCEYGLAQWTNSVYPGCGAYNI